MLHILHYTYHIYQPPLISSPHLHFSQISYSTNLISYILLPPHLQLHLSHITYQTYDKFHTIRPQIYKLPNIKPTHSLKYSSLQAENSINHPTNSIPHTANSIPYAANSIPHIANSIPHATNFITHALKFIPNITKNTFPVAEITNNIVETTIHIAETTPASVCQTLPTYNTTKHIPTTHPLPHLTIQFPNHLPHPRRQAQKKGAPTHGSAPLSSPILSARYYNLRPLPSDAAMK